jgi:hypothetical protein
MVSRGMEWHGELLFSLVFEDDMRFIDAIEVVIITLAASIQIYDWRPQTKRSLTRLYRLAKSKQKKCK